MRGFLAALLLALLAVVATRVFRPLLVSLVLPFLAALLAAQVDRAGGELATSLVSAAAVLLPAGERGEFRDEWLDHVEAAGERGPLPLTRAISIALIAAPALAVGLRVGRRKRRASK